jgi:hypothetical protein
MKSLFELGFFNINKSKDDKKEAKKEIDVQQLEDLYDKKYNGFCLAISKYDKEKIKNVMDKKSIELKLAQDELRDTSDKSARVELKIKIDYLKNVINRCKVKVKNYKGD